MNRDRVLSLAAQTVDVLGSKRERASRADRSMEGLAAEPRSGLVQGARDDANRSGGEVVVMPAGVARGGPGDHPDIDVVVAMKRGKMTAARHRLDSVSPCLRSGRQVIDEGSQLMLLEISRRQGAQGQTDTSLDLAGL